MSNIFEEKYEELFGDVEEKLEDLVHSCMVNKFGEKILDSMDEYAGFLGAAIDSMAFDLKNSLDADIYDLESDIIMELEWDDEIDEEMKASEPWDIKELKEKEVRNDDKQKQLDDL